MWLCDAHSYFDSKHDVIMVSQSKRSGNRTWREPSAEKLLPLGDYEQKRRAIEEQQKAEYQDFLKKVHDECWKGFDLCAFVRFFCLIVSNTNWSVKAL